MEISRRTFAALGLLVTAVLCAATAARFLMRSPDDAGPIGAPAQGSSIRSGGPPGPSAEMESGLTGEEVTPDGRAIPPQARAQAEPPRKVRSTPRPPRPSPRSRAPAVQIPAARAPAPRDTQGVQGPAAGAGPSSPGGNQGAQAPAAIGVDAPPHDAAREPAAAQRSVEPAPVPAATPKPAPVLAPPVPVTLEPPRHPDAWRVVVESPGLAAEVRPEGLTARVRLRLRVGDDGAVERVDIAVSSGRPDLDAAAATAAKAWRFLPARRDGVAIASAVLIWVAFVIGP